MKEVIPWFCLVAVIILGVVFINVSNQVQDEKINSLELRVNELQETVSNLKYYFENKSDTIIVEVNYQNKVKK